MTDQQVAFKLARTFRSPISGYYWIKTGDDLFVTVDRTGSDRMLDLCVQTQKPVVSRRLYEASITKMGIPTSSGLKQLEKIIVTQLKKFREQLVLNAIRE